MKNERIVSKGRSGSNSIITILVFPDSNITDNQLILKNQEYHTEQLNPYSVNTEKFSKIMRGAGVEPANACATGP